MAEWKRFGQRAIDKRVIYFLGRGQLESKVIKAVHETGNDGQRLTVTFFVTDEDLEQGEGK